MRVIHRPGGRRSFVTVRSAIDSPTAALGAIAPRIGALAMLAHGGAIRRYTVILGLGDLSLRATVIPSLPEDAAATVAHPRAYISPTATIGRGVFIGPHAVIHADAVIGDHATVNSGAVVEHDCVVGLNSHVAPGAVLGGQVTVGDHTLIGLGARALPGVTIGSRCVIGAGAAVVGEVNDGELVVGVPARVVER